MGGKGGAGGGGMPPGVAEMLSDPELMSSMQNPKVMQAMSEMMGGNPAALGKYANDPEVMGVINKLMSKMGGMGGMPGMGGKGGMPSAPPQAAPQTNFADVEE